jgi:hypothetical protein
MSKKVSTTVLRPSTGRRVRKGDVLGVWYSGILAADPSSRFDSNFDFATATDTRSPFTFELGAGQVIPGWEQALSNRRIGEVIELYIPAELGYGTTGSPPSIPGNADLIFTVELIAAKPSNDESFVFPRFRDLGLNQTEVRKLIEFRKSLVSDSIVGESPVNLLGYDQENILTGKDFGELKADILLGFAGNDQLKGGLGADLLIGGQDADKYIYANITDAATPRNGLTSRETILGFNQAEGDQIDLSEIAGDGFDRITWINKREFSGTSGELRFDAGLVSIDANGDKRSDFEIELTGIERISKSAFIF